MLCLDAVEVERNRCDGRTSEYWPNISFIIMKQVVERLIKEPKPYRDSNRIKGGNPKRGNMNIILIWREAAFVGDPYDKESFGTFHGPITTLLESFAPALDLTGSSFDGILLHLRHSKSPIIVWCTLEMKEPSLTDIWNDYKEEGSWKFKFERIGLVS